MLFYNLFLFYFGGRGERKEEWFSLVLALDVWVDWVCFCACRVEVQPCSGTKDIHMHWSFCKRWGYWVWWWCNFFWDGEDAIIIMNRIIMDFITKLPLIWYSVGNIYTGFYVIGKGAAISFLLCSYRVELCWLDRCAFSSRFEGDVFTALVSKYCDISSLILGVCATTME